MRLAFCSISFRKIPNHNNKLLIKLILIGLIILLLVSNFASCARYNTKESFEELLGDTNNWTWNGTKWDATQGGYLTSGSIYCGEWVNISTKAVGPCIISFDWYKIGNAVLKCYYDNNADPINSPVCDRWSFGPCRIRIPTGIHTVTWDLKMESCNENPGSEANIDNINIPEPKPEDYLPDCTINTKNQIILGQESMAMVPSAGYGANYDWQISKGGVIKSKMPYNNKIILKAMNVSRIKLKVAVRNESGSDSGSVEINVKGKDEIPITSDMDLNEKIRESENKILVLENGTYPDEIIINVKNLVIKSKYWLGAKFDTRGSNFCITIDNTSDVSIDGLSFTDCKCGIIIYNSTNCSVNKNDIRYKNLPGIYINNGNFNNITNNYLQSEVNGSKQGIRLHNSSYNFLENNSIVSNYGIYILNLKSKNNMIKHDIKKFPGIIYNFDDKINCSINCTRNDHHRLNCSSHLENRMDCSECTLCDKIGINNNWECI
jgi:parallel beta-helix repeat protein